MWKMVICMCGDHVDALPLMFETVNHHHPPPMCAIVEHVQATGKHEGMPTMAKQSNVVTKLNVAGGFGGVNAVENVEHVALTSNVKSHGTRPDIIKKLGPVHAATCSYVLNWSNCSKADLIAYATDTATIKLQSMARAEYHKPYDPETKKGNMGKDGKTPQVPFSKIAAKYMSGTIDVKAVLMSNVRSTRKDLVTKTAENVEKMSPEQRKAMMAMLKNMDSK